ncbi:MAG: alpha-glucan family phosphorylase [bacterium]|nr:alpha-glucan family phosphorylase [bacterium]MDT8396922.1 alpha-glucan family phosphorylase [bacterium]
MKIAYFTMEIGLRPEIPTYSGGLGVLAGDTIKSAADLGLPMVVVTLLSRQGYFTQELDKDGTQFEHPVHWNPADLLELLPERITVQIKGHTVHVGVWRYNVLSLTGSVIPVYFLDTDLEENSAEDQAITRHLYGGDRAYRLMQEVVLGIGGVRMLNELGHDIYKYHLNEGHSALLTLELLNWFRLDIRETWDEKAVWNTEAVRERCIFTTHTPVEAGHDRFSWDLVTDILGEPIPMDIFRELGGQDNLNMTLLALNLCNYVNGVAKRHGEISREMFAGYHIHSITNGVHSFTWTCEHFQELYNRYLPGWANEPELFVRVDHIPDEEIWNAHMAAKTKMIGRIEERTGIALDPDVLTLGFARRATSYKRADLLFSDMERLTRIGDGRLQIVYAGKAHPHDEPGKALIRRIFDHARTLAGKVTVVYLPDYNMEMACCLVSGVDVWLNTPLRPMEASGTSGMKAAHNGVPNFSVLDGWWVEGHIEGVTGWSIGPRFREENQGTYNGTGDVEDLYSKLEKTIMPLFYDDRAGWVSVMKNAIGKNAYYFNSHRMMRFYVTYAYLATHVHERGN